MYWHLLKYLANQKSEKKLALHFHSTLIDSVNVYEFEETTINISIIIIIVVAVICLIFHAD